MSRRTRPILLSALGIFATVVIGTAIAGSRGEPEAGPAGAGPIRSPSAAAGTPIAPTGEPIAFRYRGQLCSSKGCLLSAVVSLCKATAVHSLLVRVEAVPGSDDTQATMIAVSSSGRPWGDTSVLDLADTPFRPVKVWTWPGSLPPWEDWCARTG